MADVLVRVAVDESAMAAASRIAGDDDIPAINHPGSRLGTRPTGVNPLVRVTAEDYPLAQDG
jgi:hypothetical protein